MSDTYEFDTKLYEGDLVDAISHARSELVKRIEKFEFRHKAFRRLGSIASFVFLLGLMTSTTNMESFFGIKLTDSASISGPIWNTVISEYHISLIIINLILLLLIGLSLFISINKKNNKIIMYTYCSILLYGLLNLLSIIFFDWKILSLYLISFGALIFVVCYSTNRKYGYTRGWSRNRVYLTQLDILMCENKE